MRRTVTTLIISVIVFIIPVCMGMDAYADDYAAQIGDTKYETLAAACGAASEGQTIKLLRDVEEHILVGRTITLDLNGKTLKSNEYDDVVHVNVNENLTLTIEDSSADGSGKIINTSERTGTGIGIYGGTLVLNGGTVEAAQSAIILSFASAEINNAKVTSASGPAINIFDESVSLTINDGTFVGTNPCIITGDNPDARINGGKFSDDSANSKGFIFPEGKKLKKEGDYYVLKDGAPDVTVEFGSGHEVAAATWAAYLNEQYEGCAAAVNGTAVTLQYIETFYEVESLEYMQKILSETLSGCTDNGEIIGSVPLARKPLPEYTGWDEIEGEVNIASVTPMPYTQKFYCTWLTPVNQCAVKIDAPYCGESNSEISGRSTNPPKVTLDNGSCSALWVEADGNSPFKGSFVCGNEYIAKLYISPSFGSYFPNWIDTSVTGGTVDDTSIESEMIGMKVKVEPKSNPAAPVRENEIEATAKESGSYDEVIYCKGCHKELSRTTKVIPKLNPAAQTITGKAKLYKSRGDNFNLNLSAKTTIKYSSSNSKVAAVDDKGNVKITGFGKATIKATAIKTDKYKEASKEIQIVSRLKKPLLSTKTTGKGRIKLSWKKVDGATGYKVYVKMPGSKKYVCKLDKSAKVKSVTHSNLKKGKTYKYKVKAYRKVNGKIKFTRVSKVKTVRVTR